VNADFAVVIDACVLVKASVTDLLLRLAETPRLYLPLWSDKILEETREALLHRLKRPWPPELVKNREANMRLAFPEALITFPDDLLEVCKNHQDDRHVLAVAIVAGAEVFVTENLDHFPAEALTHWGVSACSSDDLLLSLFGLDELLVVRRLSELAEDVTNAMQRLNAALLKKKQGDGIARKPCAVRHT
jgi:predicted nucleic acid-binding protein